MKPKTVSKPLTPKQAEIKVGSLIRGIDNFVTRIKKDTALVVDAMLEFKQVLPALSNTTKAAKVEKTSAKVEKTSAKVEKTSAKVEKTSAKPPKKEKAASPLKAARKAKPPVKERPTIKEAIQEMLKTHGSLPPADLWKKTVDKYGYWSRQSLYNALKDDNLFKKSDGVISLVPNRNKDKDKDKDKDDGVDSFVDVVLADKSVAHVT